MSPARQLTVLLASLGLLASCAPQVQTVPMSAISPAATTAPAAVAVPAGLQQGAMLNQELYCILAPEGYVITQDKWDPYAVPCPLEMMMQGGVPVWVVSRQAAPTRYVHVPAKPGPVPPPPPAPPGPDAAAATADRDGADSAVISGANAASAHAGRDGAFVSVSSASGKIVIRNGEITFD